MEKLYNVELFNKWVKLDESSETGLSWIAPRYFSGTPNFSRVGMAAGHFIKNHGRSSYYNLRLEGLDYLVHRVIWVLANGTIDKELQVDHIDRDGFNNKLDNLRLVLPSVNNKNKSKNINNSTGFTGIHLSETEKTTGYRAEVTINSKRKRKFFSIAKYGESSALLLAREYRDTLILQDLDYTLDHGI